MSLQSARRSFLPFFPPISDFYFGLPSELKQTDNPNWDKEKKERK